MNLYHISLGELARLSEQAYSSLRRWRSRIARGEPPVNRPGPKKIEPLDLERFTEELGKLVHKRKRSLGTGALHAAFDASLSRRDIDKAVCRAREQHNALERARLHHVEWLQPNLCWAMDDTKFAGRSGYIHTIRDLCSRFQFKPLTGEMASGEQVANHLEMLFRKHGAPLFLKRDNGANLNCKAVNDVLSRWWVIPLNSPVHCPEYNGAVENAQKDWDRILDAKDPLILENLNQCARLAAHELNHMPRPCLGGRIACTTYHSDNKLRVNKRYRKNAYEWIKNKSLELIDQEDKHPACAWRTAVLTWLQVNHYINIKHPKCVTRFSSENRS